MLPGARLARATISSTEAMLESALTTSTFGVNAAMAMARRSFCWSNGKSGNRLGFTAWFIAPIMIV
ncbi:Uncharacterised protein [Bordetella pertussis]|nr:Uncharacterised protein [Bordetella pertussis]